MHIFHGTCFTPGKENENSMPQQQVMISPGHSEPQKFIKQSQILGETFTSRVISIRFIFLFC